MQKVSETVYTCSFWLISGLLVWLVILPIALICLPVILLVRVLGQGLFQMPQSNIAEAERQSHTSPESRPGKAIEQLLTSLLLTTIVELPAMLASIISLQPTRLIKREPEPAQMLQPQQALAHSESSTDSVEVAVEENMSDR